MVLVEIMSVLFVIVSIPLTVFWLIMAIDAVKTNKERYWLWVAVTVVGSIVGAAVYYTMVFQKQRKPLKKPDLSMQGIKRFLNNIPKIVTNAPQDQQIAWYALFAGLLLLIVGAVLWIFV